MIRRRTTRRARAEALAPFGREAVDRLVARAAIAAPACVDPKRRAAIERSAFRALRVPATAVYWPHPRRSAKPGARWRPPSACSASVSVRWASESIRIRTPARAAPRALMSERSRRSGLALISSIVPVARGRGEHRIEIDRVGLAPPDQAPGGVPDRFDQRVLDCGDHALGHLLLAHPERRVHACDHPVELGEQLVLVVERAVGQDVDLAAREQLDPIQRARLPRAPARSGGAAARARHRRRSRVRPSDR